MSGRAILLGIDVARYPKQVHARIGVCFEQPNLYEELSGVDNLRLFARLFNIRDIDIAGLLHRVGLDGRGDDLVGHYSKGMKQRLMIARALVNRPDILFLDEPTEGLDPTSAEAIRRVICEEQERGATVFLTTQICMRPIACAIVWHLSIAVVSSLLIHLTISSSSMGNVWYVLKW